MFRLFANCGVLILIALSTALATAADHVWPAASHPWAAFKPGAWKLVRVKSDSFDLAGHVVKSSVTETKTTLLEVNPSTYDLLVEVTVEVDGKCFSAEPRIVRQGFYGESPGDKVQVQPLRDETYRLGDQDVPVKTAKVEYSEQDRRHVSTLYYSEVCRSRLLRRESDLIDAAGNLLCRTTTNTVAMNTTFQLQGAAMYGWQRHTEQTSPQGRVILNETQCAELPGGVAAHQCQELDAAGHLVLSKCSYSY